MTVSAPSLAPYVPRLARGWERPEGFLVVEGSLLAVAISAAHEPLPDERFAALVDEAERFGGDVLMLRGDAIVVLFDGAEHEGRAAAAAVALRGVTAAHATLRAGIHSGECALFLLSAAHRALIAAGPAAGDAVRRLALAGPGEIVVSAATAAALDPGCLALRRESGWTLDPAAPTGVSPPPPSEAPPSEADLDAFVPAGILARLRAGWSASEHRRVTVGAVGFSGTDALFASEAAAGVERALRPLAAAVAHVESAFGVGWIETGLAVDGGTLLLVVGAPQTATADEERMLSALRSLLDAAGTLALHAGASSGRVLIADRGSATRRSMSITGEPVSLAVRLAAGAAPGELLATPELLQRSRLRYETRPRPLLVPEGNHVTAWSVGAAEARHEPEEQLPLVGREVELARLDEELAAARRRALRVVELVGDPGMGKSRLVAELQTRAVGFAQLVARCDAYTARTAFAPFRPLMRQLAGITAEAGADEAGSQLTAWVHGVMPELAPWLPLVAIAVDAEVAPTAEVDDLAPEFRQGRLLDAIAGFVARALPLPTLIVVEDAHWLDDASRQLLTALAADRDRPWLVVVTTRPDGAWLVRSAGHGVELRLESLPAVDAGRLALASARSVALSDETLAELVAASGGNPLFVRELVDSLERGELLGELPATVESVITARLDTLSPGERELLRSAAVLGSPFDAELLREVLADERSPSGEVDGDTDWAGALAEFVVPDAPGRLRFRHDLIRSAAYEGLPPERRNELHGRVADSLERRSAGAGNEQAALLSLHFSRAGRHDRAWQHAVIGGDWARRRSANTDAARLYERALAAAAHLPELATRSIATVAEALGDVCELAARYRQAAEAYEQARELGGPDNPAQARLLVKQGDVCERQGLYDDALAWYERGLEQLGGRAASTGDQAGQARLELAYAGARFRRGEYEEAVLWANKAVRHADEAGDGGALAHASYLVATADIHLGRAGEAALLSAVTMLEESGDFMRLAHALNNLGIDAYLRGRWDEAVACYRRGGEASRRAGDVVNAMRAVNNEAEVMSDRGLSAEAESAFAEALRAWRAAGYTVGVALATSNLGRLAARTGRFAEAHRLLDEALAQFEAIGAEALAVECDARRAECLVLEARGAEAAELALAAHDRAADANLLAGVEPMLERLHGWALLQVGRPDAARPHVERSLALARERQSAFEVALTLQALARLDGDDALAREAGEILGGLAVVATPPIWIPT